MNTYEKMSVSIIIENDETMSLADAQIMTIRDLGQIFDSRNLIVSSWEDHLDLVCCDVIDTFLLDYEMGAYTFIIPAS